MERSGGRRKEEGGSINELLHSALKFVGGQRTEGALWWPFIYMLMVKGGGREGERGGGEGGSRERGKEQQKQRKKINKERRKK